MKNKKILGTILGAIVLGAIGSGLWAKLFAPAFDWIIDKSIRFLSTVFVYFKNYYQKNLLYFSFSEKINFFNIKFFKIIPLNCPIHLIFYNKYNLKIIQLTSFEKYHFVLKIF